MTMSAFVRAARLLGRIDYPGLGLEAGIEDGGAYLRVTCPNGTDNVTGEPYAWTGRKWLLSVHMTDGEIVQTAWMAIQAALEHEAREQFLFQGVAIFAPHFDIHKLVAFAADPANTLERG